ncbi:MAG TPA: helix-turn-helix domain-containing protein [Candidatus Nesterenkonia stercoripullorum]|uniref:Helix-turn-helix domain-containing protein n=1 Tax=Candidatus Nesterenkonia stercoripullorum TaxID=2838701 RepID=A0A9D1UV95_9MICC|nr:helix-turn-helix domain-containing protein [Candidatus Nesterenkonia stercoripullorum]
MKPVELGGIAGTGLAQRIIDVLGPTVQQHINLMDADAVVIASTDTGRIGSRHQGAEEVLRTGQPVLVSQPIAGHSDRPGINLPLVIDHDVCGVIGVTGEPKDVEPLAQVVALTVELLIEQDREHRTSAAAWRAARDLVTALSSGARARETAQELLSSAGMPRGPWTIGVWAARKARRDGSAIPPANAEQLVREINDGTSPGVPGRGRAVVWQGLLWAVVQGETLDEDLAGEDARRFITRGVQEVDVLSSWVQDMNGLSGRVALMPRSDEHFVPPQELTVLATRLTRDALGRLAQQVADLSAGQRAAICALAATNSLSEGARRLFLHRNTLLQRVTRIQELTGRDLRTPDDAVVLRLAVLAEAALADESRLHPEAGHNALKNG